MNPLATINHLAHTRAQDCYQCGKCTAGCPVADAMDSPPNQLVRQVQLGAIDTAARSQAIWLCVSCQTCSTRCPQSVNCAGVLDALRQVAVEASLVNPAQRRTVAFQQAFLDNIRRNGRINELELVGQFKTTVFLKDLNIPFLMKDALLAPKLMRKGKFHLRSARARNRGVVDRIFARCLAQRHDTLPQSTSEAHH